MSTCHGTMIPYHGAHLESGADRAAWASFLSRGVLPPTAQGAPTMPGQASPHANAPWLAGLGSASQLASALHAAQQQQQQQQHQQQQQQQHQQQQQQQQALAAHMFGHGGAPGAAHGGAPLYFGVPKTPTLHELAAMMQHGMVPAYGQYPPAAYASLQPRLYGGGGHRPPGIAHHPAYAQLLTAAAGYGQQPHGIAEPPIPPPAAVPRSEAAKQPTVPNSSSAASSLGTDVAPSATSGRKAGAAAAATGLAPPLAEQAQDSPTAAGVLAGLRHGLGTNGSRLRRVSTDRARSESRESSADARGNGGGRDRDRADKAVAAPATGGGAHDRDYGSDTETDSDTEARMPKKGGGPTTSRLRLRADRAKHSRARASAHARAISDRRTEEATQERVADTRRRSLRVRPRPAGDDWDAMSDAAGSDSDFSEDDGVRKVSSAEVLDDDERPRVRKVRRRATPRDFEETDPPKDGPESSVMKILRDNAVLRRHVAAKVRALVHNFDKPMGRFYGSKELACERCRNCFKDRWLKPKLPALHMKTLVRTLRLQACREVGMVWANNGGRGHRWGYRGVGSRPKIDPRRRRQGCAVARRMTELLAMLGENGARQDVEL